MVKKKRFDQEDIKQTNENETTDNKEYTNSQEILPKANPVIEDAESVGSDTAVPDKDVDDKKALDEKLAELQDKYVRLAAEFDNYRKRTLREKMDLSKYAGENILLKILPIMDDFERALKEMDLSTNYEALKNGIDLIYCKLLEFLKQNGVREIDSMNAVFNVNLHDAVANVPVEDEEKKGKVVDVILKGYYLQDKVLRFSKVIVGE